MICDPICDPIHDPIHDPILDPTPSDSGFFNVLFCPIRSDPGFVNTRWKMLHPRHKFP